METLSPYQANMRLPEFGAFHEPALATDELKYGVILNILQRAARDSKAELSYWTLGGPGQCAVKVRTRSIVLGALDEGQCRRLAELTAASPYPGIIGADLTAQWFTDRARELGVKFREPVTLQLHSLSDKPRYPGVPGQARTVTAQDAPLFSEWMMTFHREAVPHDPVPSREELERPIGEGRFLFWMDGGQPVSMAGVVRTMKSSAAIAGVYTPAALRGRGYAGSVTAAVVDRIYAGGRTVACLYTNLEYPSSNRCYAKIGFRPVGRSQHFYRQI